MKRHSVQKPRPILLPIVLVAGLMPLFWWIGDRAGRSGSRPQPGGEAQNQNPGKTEIARLAGSPSNPEAAAAVSTAALLQTTLQRLKENSGAGIGFYSRLEEARLIKELAETSTPQLLDLVGALLDEGSSDAEEMAGRILGPVLLARDPAGVWAWMRDGAGSGSAARTRFLSGSEGVFNLWAKRDPAGALAAWYREATPLVAAGKLDGKGFGAIFRAWGEASPGAALEAAESLTDPALRKSAAAGIAASLTKLFGNDPDTWPPEADTMLNRALAFSGDEARHGIGGIIKSRLRYQPPLEVAAWADELKASPEQKIMLDKAIVDPWMESEPAAAADWYLSRVPPGEEAAHAQAMERSIRKWTRLDDQARVRDTASPPDLAAASEWLNAQGLGPQSQGAMAALAQAWGQAGEPEAAIAWARALPDEVVRAKAMETVTEEIRQRFPNDWVRLTQP